MEMLVPLKRAIIALPGHAIRQPPPFGSRTKRPIRRYDVAIVCFVGCEDFDSTLPIGIAAAAVGTRLGASVAGLSFLVHDGTRSTQARSVPNARIRIVPKTDRIEVGRAE